MPRPSTDRREYSPELKQKVIADLKAGIVPGRIAAKRKVSLGRVYAWRKEGAPDVSLPGQTKKYSDDFKIDAASRVVVGDQTQTAVAAELGITSSMVSKWVKQFGDQALERAKAAERPASGAFGDLTADNTNEDDGMTESMDAHPGMNGSEHANGAAAELDGRSRHADSAKAAAVSRLNAGESVATIAGEYGVSSATIYAWRKALNRIDAKIQTPADDIAIRYGRLRQVVTDAIGWLKDAEKHRGTRPDYAYHLAGCARCELEMGLDK